MEWGVPTLEKDAWALMLEAADRLDAYATAVTAIRANIEDLVTTDLSLRDATEVDLKEVERLRIAINARNRQRHYLAAKVRGLRIALEELVDAVPIHWKPAMPAEPELPLDTHDEWSDEAPEIPEAAPQQSGGPSDAAAAAESVAVGDPLPPQIAAPAELYHHQGG